MIIGNGDIASVLPDRDDLLFFASGVSNSRETDGAAYDRELSLLFKQKYSRHIVYFSSLCVFDTTSYYARHKRKMEDFVKRSFDTWTIIRIGNITWGNNPNTFLNYIKNKLALGEKVELRDEYKYMVEKEEFLYWIDRIPEWSCEMNIPGKRMKVEQAVKEYGNT